MRQEPRTVKKNRNQDTENNKKYSVHNSFLNSYFPASPVDWKGSQ